MVFFTNPKNFQFLWICDIFYPLSWSLLKLCALQFGVVLCIFDSVQKYDSFLFQITLPALKICNELLFYLHVNSRVSFLNMNTESVCTPQCEPYAISPVPNCACIHLCLHSSLCPSFFPFFLALLPSATPALIFVAVVTGQPWLLHTRPNPSPRPSAFWRAHPKSGACTPSSETKKPAVMSSSSTQRD